MNFLAESHDYAYNVTLVSHDSIKKLGSNSRFRSEVLVNG